MLESLISHRCEDAGAWVEENIIFPPALSPNLPGRVTLARQPWMREILASYLDPALEHLHLVMGTQTGKTTACLLGTALLLAHDPGPLMWALPTDELAKRACEMRLVPLLTASPALARHLPPRWEPKRDRLVTDVMPIYVTGAIRPAKLASLPCAYIIADEEAKFEHLYRNEAHPVLLLSERTKAFARHLMVHASTPNDEENYFWQGWLASDQRYYYVPCPECGLMQRLEWNRDTVIWDHPQGTELTADIVQATARYVCQGCHAELGDTELTDAMQRGEWRATNPAASSRRRGYHINSLYSPFVTIGEMAREFWLASVSKASESYQNFVNSWLGQPYTHYAYKIDEDNILALRGNHVRGVCPWALEDVYYIVTCYDPGQAATHWVTTAIGPGGAMAVLDYGTVLALADVVPHFRRSSVQVDGVATAAHIGYVDSGDWTAAVYDLCATTAGQLTPTKGTAAGAGTWTRQELRTHPGLELVTYRDYAAKRALYGERVQMRQGAPLLLPADMDQELIDGLSGQQLQRLPGGKTRWKPLPNDHYGDCIKLALVSWWTLQSELEPPEEQPTNTPS